MTHRREGKKKWVADCRGCEWEEDFPGREEAFTGCEKHSDEENHFNFTIWREYEVRIRRAPRK